MNSPAPATPDGHRVSLEVDGTTITLETGRIAKLATAAVIARAGNLVVLATVASAPTRGPGAGFLPLTVEYREKAASSGRIPGGFGRREGRITEDEVLASRILDRSIRPLFPKGFEDEVQVQATVLSADLDSDDAPLLALLATAAALHLSPLPWAGPVAGVRVIRDGGLRAFASHHERERADLDLIVTAGHQGLVMVEGGADEASEDDLLEALARARQWLAPCLEALDELRARVGPPASDWRAPEEPEGYGELHAWLDEGARPRLRAALFQADKQRRGADFRALCEELIAALPESLRESVPDAAAAAGAYLRKLRDRFVREVVLDDGVRLDGRREQDVRPIWCETGWLPTPHGSAVFTRGETQALVTCTLGSQKMEQMIETARGMTTNRFLLHYNFPPYSVGEVRPLRGPGRREIGHGHLARRALLPVLPSFKQFPYVVRLESDIAESNGSSSMATTCGGTLALLDAGVPLKAPVAGIAMGLIADGERVRILTDILGDEDHLGDMDFKVTGTRAGVTAVQMDNKVGSLPDEILRRALEQARAGRLHILDAMQAVLGRGPAKKDNVPSITPVRINPASLGELIGPRGATIKEIQAECNVEINVEDGGQAFVYSSDAAGTRKAVQKILEIAGVVQEGRVYQGTVVSVKDFGAFVRIYRSAEGLVPVAEWDAPPPRDFKNHAREGEAVQVLVRGVDERGRLQLSRKDALGAAPDGGIA